MQMDAHEFEVKEWQEAERHYEHQPKANGPTVAGALIKAMEGKKMEASRELIPSTPPVITPGVEIALRKAEADNQIELATHWAKRLMEVVRGCKMSKRVMGKEYLQVEAWLVIAEFAHCRAVAQEAKPWLDEKGELIGYTVRAVVLDQNGIEVGAGESSCGFDAFPCRGRQGSEQDKAAKGAAQTWAISRALSNRFRYVALMAGFSPTPAEEMGAPDHDNEPLKRTIEPLPPDEPLHGTCPKHNVPWQISPKTGKKGHVNPVCTLGAILFAEFAKTADAAGADTESYLANHVGPWDKAHEAKWFAAVEWAKQQLNDKMEGDAPLL